MNIKEQYDEKSVTVLKGLDPVKKRPGMYTYTDNPTHIAQEVIDNASDEALAGFASEIKLTLYEDGSLLVEDDGRGIPVGIHPDEGISVVELVFTRLHAGGKFNKQEGSAYSFSGGLHGVGVSVTNALSLRLEVVVKRDGEIWKIVFSEGFVVEPLVKIGNCSKKDTGTSVLVLPDPKYFDQADFSVKQLESLLRAKAVLLKGLKVILVNYKNPNNITQEWYYPDGMEGYLKEMMGEQESLPFISIDKFLIEAQGDFISGEGASVVFTWTETPGVIHESYVNLIPTPLGGTHESGLKQALFLAMENFIRMHNLLPRGVKLLSDDVFSHVSYILSARILDPQFQGQTKEKLINRSASRLISIVLIDLVELWLNQNVEIGKKIAEIAIKQAQARIRSVKKIEKKKGSGLAVLPGKLTDCESEDIRENELFLVEGDSAGGSAKLARDKYTQAILPLRGKVLNSYEIEKDQLFANTEIHNISVAIGVDPHLSSDDISLDGLRYGKIAILSDADVDGSHIQVLLLTLFYKHFSKLIKEGHIYIAQPPLFRIDVNARGKNQPARKYYLLDKKELDVMVNKLVKEGVRDTAYSISRFKGLGEMNPDQLKDTTMNPDTRRLLQVRVEDNSLSDELSTEQIFTLLMRKGESSARREWMEKKGNLVEADI